MNETNTPSVSYGRYLLLGLIVFAAAFSFWLNRHGAAASRLEALRESAKTDASRTADVMRGLQASAPLEPTDDQNIPRTMPKLRGRCLVLDSDLWDGSRSRLPVSSLSAWLADSWRARKLEDVSFLIWLNLLTRGSRGYWQVYDSSGKLVSTNFGEWHDDDRESWQVRVARLDGEILLKFRVDAKAVNGPIRELRSFEASLMQEIAARLEQDLWSPEILKQLQSSRYER